MLEITSALLLRICEKSKTGCMNKHGKRDQKFRLLNNAGAISFAYILSEMKGEKELNPKI